MLTRWAPWLPPKTSGTTLSGPIPRAARDAARSRSSTSRRTGFPVTSTRRFRKNEAAAGIPTAAPPPGPRGGPEEEGLAVGPAGPQSPPDGEGGEEVAAGAAAGQREAWVPP